MCPVLADLALDLAKRASRSHRKGLQRGPVARQSIRGAMFDVITRVSEVYGLSLSKNISLDQYHLVPSSVLIIPDNFAGCSPGAAWQPNLHAVDLLKIRVASRSPARTACFAVGAGPPTALPSRVGVAIALASEITPRRHLHVSTCESLRPEFASHPEALQHDR